MASSTIPAPPPIRSSGKRMLWTLLGLAALSTIPFTDLPILRDTTGINVAYRAQLWHDRFLLVPHALCGVIALLSGPVQFSTRMRRRYLPLHRVLGRIYVIAVLAAAVTALILTQGSGLEIATYVQAGSWIVCTLAAFLTARNRHIAQHRQWMVRSYAVTFTFVAVRLLNFWPAYAQMSTYASLLTIVVVTFLALLIPDIALSWRELTTRRG